jgi:hypothetical protein
VDGDREVVEDAALSENGREWRFLLVHDHADLRAPFDDLVRVVRIVELEIDVAELHLPGPTSNAELNLSAWVWLDSEDPGCARTNQDVLSACIDKRLTFALSSGTTTVIQPGDAELSPPPVDTPGEPAPQRREYAWPIRPETHPRARSYPRPTCSGSWSPGEPMMVAPRMPRSFGS